jgi:transcription-repair coupling factor (superfamily II helicase)
MAHGQMESESLEKVLLDFIDRQFDVLVCTNIIETGLDIPNANTIIINNAHQFGLSDLHQLRGRVGRSNKKAYCYLFSPPLSVLTPDARKRLRTVEEFSDLGSGFDIAMRDLDIRGAGNLLGAEQSGFIADIGFETFQKILDEAIQELKETEFREVFKDELGRKSVFVRDVVIDTDMEMHIPSDYVESIQERLTLYTELDGIETEEGITAFAEKLVDRFGKVPPQVNVLFEGLRLRWIARRLGFEQIVLKSGKLRCYFVDNPQSPYYDSTVFQQIFSFIAKHGERLGFHLKKSHRSLILTAEGIRNLHKAKDLLEMIEREAVFLPEKTPV